MHNDREPAERGPSLDVGDEVVRDFDSFLGGPEDEVARVEDELVVVDGVVGLGVLPGVLRET